MGQTAIILADKGEYARFSDECVALLIDVGHNPADFGSYAYVSKRIQAAKDRVKAWEEKAPGALAPNAHDLWLAECEAGHLHQNAIYQEKRGDDCSNTGEGLYDMEMAPCMPQWGKSTDPCTEHFHVTHKERKAAKERKKSAEVPGVYAGKLVAEDAAQRVKEIGDENADKQKDNRKVKRSQTIKRKEREAQERGDIGRQKKEDAAAALRKAKKAQERRAKKPKKPKKGGVTGDTWADCINNWHKKAFKEMRQKILREAKENRNKANDLAKKGEPEKSRKRAEKAKKALSKHKRDNPGKKEDLPPKQLQDREDLEREARKAERAHHKAKNPGCLADKAEAWFKNGKRRPLGETPDGRFPGRPTKAKGAGKKPKKGRK